MVKVVLYIVGNTCIRINIDAKALSGAGQGMRKTHTIEASRAVEAIVNPIDLFGHC